MNVTRLLTPDAQRPSRRYDGSDPVAPARSWAALARATRASIASSWTVLALLPLLVFGCGKSSPESDDAREPLNILFISCDTLRADRLGAFGHLPTTSPAIDRFTREGVLFQRAFAPRSQTWPTLTSVMTSKYPVIHGVRTNGLLLDEKHESLPEYLSDSGYATAAFLGNMSRGAHRGYDVFESNEGERADQFDRDRALADMAIEWMNQSHDRPFFLWVHFINPHGPYMPPEEFRARVYDGPQGLYDGSRPNLEKIALEQIALNEIDLRSMRADYDGDVVAADHCVGKVLDALSAAGLDDNTLVVFFSDHGDELYERNYYFMHSCSVYDSVLHVPLAMRLPQRLPSDAIVDDVVELIDITPTVCSLAGLDLPEWVQGQDLTPVIEGEPSRGRAVSEWHPPMSPTAKSRELIAGKSPSEVKRLMREHGLVDVQKGDLVDGFGMQFEEGREPIYVLRTKDYRFVMNHGEELPNDGCFNWHPGKGFPIAREELYDHRADPGERRNAVFDLTEIAAEQRDWLRTWAETMQAGAELGSIADDPETIKRLRELGYLPGGPEDDEPSDDTEEDSDRKKDGR